MSEVPQIITFYPRVVKSEQALIETEFLSNVSHELLNFNHAAGNSVLVSYFFS